MHVWHTLILMCAKNHVIMFGSFLDIRENAECLRVASFLSHPLHNVTKPLARLLEPLRIATILNIYLSNGM